MAKIVLTDTAGGFDISSINGNFQAIQNELNNKVLYRDNPVGEVNSLQTDTDVNGKRIYNLPVPVLPSEAARLQDVINATAGIIPAQFIPFTPYLDVTGLNVQTAIQEVKDDVEAADSLITTKASSAALSASSGSTLVGFTQGVIGTSPTTVQEKLRRNLDVRDFGAVGAGADETAAAVAMILATNSLHVPPEFTLICKNVELNTNTRVTVEGALKLPAGCSDFDRLIHADGKNGLSIKIKEIDGNYAGQAAANIGTHLIYLKNCNNVVLEVDYAHDHYVASGASMPSVDGTRDVSSGAILLYRCHKASVKIGLLSGWGREGIYLQECNYAKVSLGHAQGIYTTEYSGLQVKGDYNRVVRASVDFAGSSAVGFDTRYGTLNNVITTNTRENHGVNFGHTGFPATGSVANNIIVDGAFGFGIAVAASSHDVSINNFNITNAGEYGISFSDGVVKGKLSNGIVGLSALGSLNAFGSVVQTSNIRSTDLDSKTLKVTTTSGLYTQGEVVSTASGSGTVRRVIRNLSATSQIVFLTGITGTFSPSEVLTGGTSGATGSISLVNTPIRRNEASGGLYEDDIRYFEGTSNQIRFPDGTAILTTSVPCALATGGALQTFVQGYSSNVTWASAPTITASIGTVSSTGGYTMTTLRVTSNTTQISIDLNMSVAQTYGVSIIAIGRWK